MDMLPQHFVMHGDTLTTAEDRGHRAGLRNTCVWMDGDMLTGGIVFVKEKVTPALDLLWL